MIVYISGKITDNEDYFDDFQKGEQWLKLHDYKVLNPVSFVPILPPLTHEQYMDFDFNLIKMADAVFMLDGWQNSKGACAELEFAKALGKKVLYQRYFKEFRKNEE